MKTTLFTIIFALVSITGFTQSNEYYQAMGESLGEYANCKSGDDFRALGNQFDRIAQAEKDQWLPLYYQAHCNIIAAFIETDPAKKDAILDVAEKSMNRMIELAPNDADVHALHAMFYTARLVVNPMERGQKFGMLSGQAVGKALALDPTNPRARLTNLQNEMGTAQFYGKDTSVYCDDARELLAGWDNFKPKSPLHPNWGKDQVAGIVESCK
jgi:hypothetical protein